MTIAAPGAALPSSNSHRKDASPKPTTTTVASSAGPGYTVSIGPFTGGDPPPSPADVEAALPASLPLNASKKRATTPRKLKEVGEYIDIRKAIVKFMDLVGSRALQPGVLTYALFKQAWSSLNFGTANAMCDSEELLPQVLGQLYQTAVDFVCSPGSATVERAGGLYSLYTVYYCTVTEPKVRICMDTTSWTAMVNAAVNMDQNLSVRDALLMVARLKQDSSFFFCALRSKVSRTSHDLYAEKEIQSLMRSELVAAALEEDPLQGYGLNTTGVDAVQCVIEAYETEKASILRQAPAGPVDGLRPLLQNKIGIVPELQAMVAEAKDAMDKAAASKFGEQKGKPGGSGQDRGPSSSARGNRRSAAPSPGPDRGFHSGGSPPAAGGGVHKDLSSALTAAKARAAAAGATGGSATPGGSGSGGSMMSTLQQLLASKKTDNAPSTSPPGPSTPGAVAKPLDSAPGPSTAKERHGSSSNAPADPPPGTVEKGRNVVGREPTDGGEFSNPKAGTLKGKMKVGPLPKPGNQTTAGSNPESPALGATAKARKGPEGTDGAGKRKRREGETSAKKKKKKESTPPPAGTEERRTVCEVCTEGPTSKKRVIVECADCPRMYHLKCATPPLRAKPKGEWKCDVCRAEEEEWMKAAELELDAIV